MSEDLMRLFLDFKDILDKVDCKVSNLEKDIISIKHELTKITADLDLIRCSHINDGKQISVLNDKFIELERRLTQWNQ